MKNIGIHSLLLLCFTVDGIVSLPFDNVLPKKCGISRYQLALPFDNSTAGLGQFPWTTKIGLKDPATGSLFFYCTGSLIHQKFVISAGHCGEQGRIVRVGDYDLQSDTDCDECNDCAPPFQESLIRSTHYANHCRMTNLNDISLLMLETLINFNEYVQPICLTSQIMNHNEYIGKNISVAGWGVPFKGTGKALADDFSQVKEMKFIETTLATPEVCNERYQQELEHTQMCVEYPTSVPDPCVLDSGSPLMEFKTVKKNRIAYLVGVASQNLTCDANDLHPVVFTDASVYFNKFVEIMYFELQK